MSETMHIENMFVNHAKIKDKALTWVEYTQESGLSDWSGDIVGSISGTNSSPYYTTQIPNAQYIKTVQIGKTVTSIGFQAFYNCGGLTSVTIPNSVTSIGNKAFCGCLEDGEFTIPDSITSINLFATKLSSIKIGSSLIANMFTGQSLSANSNLYNFTVSEDNPNYKAVNHMLLSKDGKTLICGINGDVAIPSGVETIRDNAFDQFHNLTSIVIPDSVTSIGNGAFRRCDSLTKITFGSMTASFASSVFYNCTNLDEVHISDIGKWCECTFSGTENSNPITLTHSFYHNNAIVTNLVIPNGTTNVNIYAFSGCTALTSVTIPTSVTTLNGYAFENCTNLTSIHISDIGHWCGLSFGLPSSSWMLNSTRTLYLNGTPVTNITIPGTVTTIQTACLANCTTLTEVTLSSGTTTIGRSSFNGCTNLTKVTFPDTLTSISFTSFSGCSSLMVFDFRKATLVPTLQGVNAFANTPSNKEIIVPDSLYDSWIVATNWSSETNNIVNCIVKASQSSLGPLT